MIFKQEPYAFEVLYRPLYEFRIALIWAAGAAGILLFSFASNMPGGVTLMQLIVCLAMIASFLARGMGLYRMQRRLLGFKQEFIQLDDFVRKSRPFVERNEIWLGRGFLWTPTITQRTHELLKRDYAHIADHLTMAGWVSYRRSCMAEGWRSRGPLPVRLAKAIAKGVFPPPYQSKAMGAKWIHGLSDEEDTVAIPVDYFKGHALILGTTGSGKTRLAELLNTQSIMRGECLIIIDPKGDKELKENARRACDAYRRYCLKEGLPDPGERFLSFHPAFPAESVRLNLLSNIVRETDVASRITNLMPSEGGGLDPFVAFGWLSINTISQAQLLIGETPTIESIKLHLLDSMERITTRAIRSFCSMCDARHTGEPGYKKFDQRIDELLNDLGDQVDDGAKQVIVLGHRLFPQVKWQGDARTVSVQDEDRNILNCAVFQGYAAEPSAATIASLVKLYQHPKEHFAKMINNMIPILEMLSTGSLSTMLSMTRENASDATHAAQVSTMDIIKGNKILYVGLDSLSDGIVGSAIGSLLLSDLTAAAGAIYNFMGEKTPPINIFVDEAAECLNEPCIRLLNKGRGAKFRLIIATQTISDFRARLGSTDKATMVLGNVNNKIALRTQDPVSQEYLSQDLPETYIKSLTHSQGQNSLITNPLEHGSTQSEQLKETPAPLVAQQIFSLLPNCEYIANFAGGRVVKGRLPIIGEDMNKRKAPAPENAENADSGNNAPVFGGIEADSEEGRHSA